MCDYKDVSIKLEIKHEVVDEEDIKAEASIGVEEQQALVHDEHNMKEEEGGDDMTAEEADEERKEDYNNNEEMEEAARGDEAHVCYVCDKTLSTKGSLNQHILSVHRGRVYLDSLEVVDGGEENLQYDLVLKFLI